MRIIPAIDIIGGKCVRLAMGDYHTKAIYNENPVEVAKQFEAHGIEYLHLVDLDGAKSQCIVNHQVLKNIASTTKLSIDFSGGIKSDADIQLAFDNGASQITVGSTAFNNVDLFTEWLNGYGSDKIILGADCLNNKIAIDGWLTKTETDIMTYINFYLKRGIKYVMVTDISKDGMLQGVSVDLYKNILSKNNVQLIASGGVSSMNDLLVLKETGCEGVIIGKAIYENKISLSELSKLC